MANFSDLLGKNLSRISVLDYKEIIFTCASGEAYKLYHEQDCCENVRIEDISGCLEDLLHEPITKAEEVSNAPDPAGKTTYDDDSHTWTFYHLATVNGYVTIRWLGQSNGYYGEGVDFIKIKGLRKDTSHGSDRHDCR